MPKLPKKYNHLLGSVAQYPMILVEPGIFIMGDNQSGYDDEKPEHLVEITQPFYIGKYPVTQAVWKAVMQEHNPSQFVGGCRPVEQVSWQDIVEGGQDDSVPEAFLDRLNHDFPSQVPGYHFRLPTEAEWEYAAKGGHETALSSEHIQSFLKNSQPTAANLYTTFAGSDQLKEVGWYSQNSHSETKHVEQRQPNELGLLDMSGNVNEWCEDWNDDGFYAKCKEQGVVQDPLNTKDGRTRVNRGGSWRFDAARCRVSSRYSWFPADRLDDIGFRLVLAPVQ